MQTDSDTVAWYRQFWPWFIMVPPACAILGSAITIWLAMSNPPQLVVADYARIEETNELNRTLGVAAESMGLEAVVQINQLDGSNNRDLKVVLSHDGSVQLPAQILFRLVHATTPGFDRNVLLVLDGKVYRGTVDLPADKYVLQIEDTDTSWRLSGEFNARMKSVALGNPAP